jgi:ABC-2 type transport system ATP-binding protein
MIRAEHLTKRFGKLTAVDDISFEIQAGEIFAFLGPNGAGKTTTIKMLTTILSPTGGTVELNGLNLAGRKSEARRDFGVVFQDPSLDLDLTAWENMDLHGVLYGMPRKLSHHRAEGAAEVIRAVGPQRLTAAPVFRRDETTTGSCAWPDARPEDPVSR